MKQLFILTKLHLYRMLRRPTFLAALLVPLLLLLALAFFSPTEREATVTVGIFVEENSAAADTFYQELFALQTPPVGFVIAESRTQLEEMVAANLWECGYILPADFSARLETHTLEGIFTRVTSPGTTMHMLSNSAVLAALLTQVGDSVAAEYLSSLFIMDKSTFLGLIEDQTIRTAPYFATFTVETLDGEVKQSAEAATQTSAVRGVISIGLFLVFFLACIQISTAVRDGFFRRVSPICGSAAVFLSAPLAIFLLGLAESLLLFVIGRVIDPAYAAGGWGELLILLLYLLYLTALLFFLSAVVQPKASILAFLPFLLLSCLILVPLFVDVVRFLPALYPVTLFIPPALYYRAATGSSFATGLMIVLTVLLPLFSYWVLRRRKI